MLRPRLDIHISSTAEDAVLTAAELSDPDALPPIEPAPTTRAGWFDGYRAEDDPDAWADLPLE